MKRIDLLKILKDGGATLDASGAAVSFRRGYQVSRKDSENDKQPARECSRGVFGLTMAGLLPAETPARA